MTQKMLTHPSCPVQQLFVQCIRSWLGNSETPTPDVSQVYDEQRELVAKALEDQERIGWHLAMRGYLSRHWALAVAANPHLIIPDEDDLDAVNTLKPKDVGRNWARKSILQLWKFAEEMWEHRNAVLHDTKLEASRKIRDADINDEIEKLYANVDSYAVEDRWYFEMPLALRLRKPLRSRRRWLVLARTLAAKSGYRAMIGQMPMTAFFQPRRSFRRVVNTVLEDPRVNAVTNFVQTTLSSWRPQDPSSRPP